MDSLKKREDEFERKFSHDQELKFKIHARCAKLFGKWAADTLGAEAVDIEKYPSEMIALSMQKQGMSAIKNKVSNDFHAHNINVSEHMIEKTLAEKLEQAEKEITERENGT